MNIPKIEYEVYYPLFNKGLIQLNLTECKNKKIDISIPVSIKEDLNKYNQSSDYYNDLCSKTTSESGTDITLKDRKNIFIDKNMTLCEENCDLIDYNYTSKKAKCSCDIKIKVPLIEEIRIDKDKLKKSFTDIKNIGNFKLMKCYKIVFNKNCIKKNYGFYIYIFIYILFFVCLILFYLKYYLYIENEINEISNIKKQENTIIKETIEENNVNKSSDEKEKIHSRNKIEENNFINENLNNLVIMEETNPELNNKIQPIKKKKKKKKKKKLRKAELKEINDDNKNIKYKEILNYTDSELNSIEYEKALELDKRTFFQYWFSLLKEGNLLIFAFYIKKKDYNSPVIKIFLFFFFFALNLTVNALFFNDNTMHQIYEDEGSFNFIYQIPQILFSFIISTVIDTIIRYLSLSEDNILEFKREKDIINLESETKKILKTLKIKFVLFFVISFIFLFLFLYYITCFCGIFENTQIHLIKDSFIGFALSLITPFGIYLIPSLLRTIA